MDRVYGPVPPGHVGLWREKPDSTWVRLVPGGDAVRAGYLRVRDTGRLSGESMWVYRPIIRHLYNHWGIPWQSYVLCASPRSAQEIAEAALTQFYVGGGFGDWGFFKDGLPPAQNSYPYTVIDDWRLRPRAWVQ